MCSYIFCTLGAHSLCQLLWRTWGHPQFLGLVGESCCFLNQTRNHSMAMVPCKKVSKTIESAKSRPKRQLQQESNYFEWYCPSRIWLPSPLLIWQVCTDGMVYLIHYGCMIFCECLFSAQIKLCVFLCIIWIPFVVHFYTHFVLGYMSKIFVHIQAFCACLHTNLFCSHKLFLCALQVILYAWSLVLCVLPSLFISISCV